MVKRILVADDETCICTLLVDLLASRYPQVVVSTVHTGREFYSLFTSCRDFYDMGIVDVRMPEWDGEEAVEFCRSLGVDTPILFISGHTGQVDGPNFLQKPFSAEALLDRVKKALRL
jgi:DNA-binding response OmpR family regulator